MNKFLYILFILIVGALGVMFYVMQNSQTNPTAGNDTLSMPYAKQANPTGAMIGETEKVEQEPLATTEQPMVKATKAIIKTSKGDITVELYPEDAPRTVTNFANKVTNGFYTNLTFHRVEDWVIQGGDPEGTGTGGGDMASEFNNKPYIAGSLGVARRNDPKVQNDSQFFITKSDASWLNGQYTNFGTVIEGMDVVNTMEIGDKILSVSLE